MSCPDYTESLNALLDGELPPEQAAPLTAHLAACPACTQTLAELAQLRAGLAQVLPEEPAPAELQARIEAMLAAEEEKIVPFKPKSRRLPNTGWAAVAALAAALMLTFLPRHDVTKDLLSVHDAALRSGPDVMASTMASAPVVAGFQLTASHMDIVAGHIAQVSVYTKNGQTITLSSWPANGEPAHGVKHAQFRGMDIAYWNDGKTEFWAASTSPNADMQGFVAELTAS